MMILLQRPCYGVQEGISAVLLEWNIHGIDQLLFQRRLILEKLQLRRSSTVVIAISRLHIGDDLVDCFCHVSHLALMAWQKCNFGDDNR